MEIKNQYVLKRIAEDRKHFQEVIGGREWTEEDVLIEWVKILDSIRDHKVSRSQAQMGQMFSINPKTVEHLAKSLEQALPVILNNPMLFNQSQSQPPQPASPPAGETSNDGKEKK